MSGAQPDDVLQPWTVQAINLAEHADNPVHTDKGAQAAGFERALVAGTTVYAYLTHVPSAAWGTDWIRSGGGELKLIRPVFEADPVECVVALDETGAPTIAATVGGAPKASLELWKNVEAPAVRPGDALPPIELTLDRDQVSYGRRCGDDLTLYAQLGVVHPVLWANLANRVFKESLVTGPWVHVRSKFFHQGLAPVDAALRIESVLVDRFDSRAGERALVDIVISANGEPVVTIEHEAIVELA